METEASFNAVPKYIIFNGTCWTFLFFNNFSCFYVCLLILNSSKEKALWKVVHNCYFRQFPDQAFERSFLSLQLQKKVLPSDLYKTWQLLFLFGSVEFDAYDAVAFKQLHCHRINVVSFKRKCRHYYTLPMFKWWHCSYSVQTVAL